MLGTRGLGSRRMTRRFGTFAGYRDREHPSRIIVRLSLFYGAMVPMTPMLPGDFLASLTRSLSRESASLALLSRF